MKERPIIFTGEMVRAILEGRKTQTRRIMPPLKHPNWTGYILTSKKDAAIECGPDYPDDDCDRVRNPYGVAGDRLWVRETFFYDDCFFMYGPLPKTPHQGWQDAFYYRADGECCDQIPECCCCDLKGTTPWRPSIFMPRWASRITLEITDVGVERLQDISAEDAIAESVDVGCVTSDFTDKLLPAFQRLWDSINAKRGFGWDKNPWVWVITFKRVQP